MDYDISNFYKEYSDNPDSFRELLKSFEEVFQMLYDYTDQGADNFLIDKSSTYKKIPFQRLDVTEATYNISDLVLSDSVAMQLGMYGLLLDKRIDMWNNEITMKQKMDALDIFGTTVMLLSFKDIESSVPDAPPVIMDFELFDDDNNQMIRNLDYAFRNNVLYLFRDLGDKNIIPRRNIILKNIYLDYNMSEKLLGKNTGIAYDANFTKNEYRDIMQSFLYSSLGGPTVSNINSSFESISYKQGFTVYDSKTTDPIKKAFWAWRVDGRSLTPFDFLVSMPIESYYNESKFNMIKNYLKIMKPAYTDFIISPELIIKEILNMKAREKEAWKTLSALRAIDKIKKIDTNKRLMRLRIIGEPIYEVLKADGVNINSFYDGVFHYDSGTMLSDIISKLDTVQRLASKQMINEQYRVKFEKNVSLVSATLKETINRIDSNKRLLKLSISGESIYEALKYDNANLNSTYNQSLYTLVDNGFNYDVASTFSELIKRLDFMKSVALKQTINEHYAIKSEKKTILTSTSLKDAIQKTDISRRLMNLSIKNDTIDHKINYDDVFNFDENGIIYEGPQALSDIISRLDTVQKILSTKNLRDNITIKAQNPSYALKHNVLNIGGQFDKIKVNKETLKNLQRTTNSDTMNNNGTMVYFDENNTYDTYLGSCASMQPGGYSDKVSILIIPKG